MTRPRLQLHEDAGRAGVLAAAALPSGSLRLRLQARAGTWRAGVGVATAATPLLASPRLRWLPAADSGVGAALLAADGERSLPASWPSPSCEDCERSSEPSPGG